MTLVLMIPLSKPYLDQDDADAVAQTVLSGWILQGPKVETFEKLIAEYVGLPYAVACSSCTTGLHMALIILGATSKEDEVIVPSYSYIATTNCVIHAHATPVFADINPKTFNIDPSDIEKKITKKTKAIIAVDQMGLLCDMPKIRAIADKHHIPVLEDAACGLGATINGQQAGTFGDIAVFSFHPKKAITTAEGGVLVTKNKEWAEYAQKLRAHGANVSVAQRSASSKVILETFPMVGYNYRMSDIHAALGISQFAKMEKIMTRRQEIAAQYNRAFEDHHIIEPPYSPPGYHHTYQSYQVRLRGLSNKRNDVLQHMLDHEIATRQGIPSAHLQPPYRDMYPALSLPHTERASDECACLPIFTTMTDKQVTTVIQTFISIVDGLSST
jgi:perosamine synthetase